MISAPARKRCLFCIVGSCIGFALFGGFPMDAELGLKAKIKQKYTLEELKRVHQSMVEQQSKGDQAPPVTKPWGMRSVVACGLLLVVMLINLQSMIVSAFGKDWKSQSGILGGNAGTVMKRMRKISQPALTSPFFWYTMLVLFVVVAYLHIFKLLQAKGYKMTQPEWGLFASAAGEGFGILWLRSRIRKHRHAQGISAKCVGLFAMLYLDTACTFPAMKSQQLDIWACKILEVVSLLLVLDVLYSILVTHRRTYQKELDVFPVRALVCVCALLAFMYQPRRVSLKQTSMAFTFRIFVDTFALVPQVVMMSLQARPVHAPIAHFVAVNAVGRMLDLMYWLTEYKFSAGPLRVSFSGWLVVLLHVASLLVVADFFYYYVKMWIVNRGFITEIPIPVAMEL